MMAGVKISLLFLAVLLVPVICLSQAANDSRPQRTIRGVVINSLTGQPIAGALVQIAGGHAALTDREGQFEITASGGAIGAFPTKPGYFAEQWGISRFEAPGLESQPVTLKLNPEAIVSGTVTDQNGQPLEGLHVQLRMLQVHDGLRHWQQMQSTATSVEGEFRFAELQPGKYSLSTSFQVDGVPNAASSVAFAPVIFPPLSGDDEAALTLAWGDHIEANLAPPTQRLYAATGHVEGAPAQAVNFEAQSSSGGMISPVVRFNRVSGDFHLLLPSGSYHLKVHSYAGREPLFGTHDISINEAPLRGIMISLAPLASIPVEAEYQNVNPSSQNTQPNQPSFLNIWLEDADPAGSATAFHARPQSSNLPGGPQTIPNVEPGHYRLVARSPSPWYLASVTCGGLDLAREPLGIAGSAAGCTIHAMLRNDSAALKWSINADSQASGSGPIFVYAIPLGNTLEPMSSSVAPAQRAGTTAQGSFESLAPGRYLVIALDHQQELPYREVDDLQRYLSLWQEVTLTQNGKSDVQLNVAAGKP
jgi:hypothetical protein